MGTLGQIFISYSHKDRAWAQRLANDLDKKGERVWIDSGLEGGDHWPSTIQNKLKASDTVLLIVSRHSRKSAEVKRELSEATGKRIIPIIHGACRSWPEIWPFHGYDFRGWYEGGLHQLLHIAPPPRPWWQPVLMLLSRHGLRVLMTVIAIVVMGVAYRYYNSPSKTAVTFASPGPRTIELRVGNGGGKASAVSAETFRIEFDGLPIEAMELRTANRAKSVTVPGHDQAKVLLEFAHTLKPLAECDGAWCTEGEALEPARLARAKVRITGQATESDGRKTKLAWELPAAALKDLIDKNYPDFGEL